MRLSDIKNIEYMFEEYRIPLFVTTDKGHFIFKDNLLGFYKNNTLRVYYINSRPQKEAEAGYRYFSKPDAVKRYDQESERVIKGLNKLVNKYKDVNFRNVSEGELIDSFMRFMKVFNAYSKVYSKTEAANLRKFEGIKNKSLIKKLKQIGKIRFKLRKSAESIFWQNFTRDS